MDKDTSRSIDTISRTCIAVRLRLLNRVVTNFYDDALRPLGLKVSQLNILIVTAKLGLARPAQVCDLLQLDASTLSRNLRPLVTAGWIELLPGPDGRSRLVQGTAAGRDKRQEAQRRWRVAQESLNQRLGAQRVVALHALLDECQDLLADLPEGEMHD